MQPQVDPHPAHGTATMPVGAPPADPDPAGEEPDLPFDWDSEPSTAAPDDSDAVFRLPRADDAEPRAGRVLGLATWAAALGVLGLAAAARGVLAMVTGTVPGWYPATIVAGGLIGIGLTVGAFLSVHRPRTPWQLLGLATVPLLANLMINAAFL